MPEATQEKEQAKTYKAGLAEITSEAFSYALQLRKSKDPGSFDTVRIKIMDHFRTLDTEARQSDIAQEDVQLAKYAICAFIDEMILTSDWPVKEQWAGKPLQLELFNDFSAGEEFYNKLDSIRNNDRKFGVLEIYYLCLSLGFKGKYVDMQGMEKRKLLTDSISRELRAGKEGKGLSPQWEPPDDLPQVMKQFPAWIAAVAAVGILLLFFLLYTIILNSIAGGVIDALDK